ncbi:hypothetical protein ACOMHN_029532 [Nucella lapillus]
MISHRWSNKKYDSAAQEWQRRHGYYKNQSINFSSACPRVQQIPLYGGSIGAENLEEMENAQERFKPLTVKRVPIPRPSETAYRPNIPGYKGCTLWQGTCAPANAHAAPGPPSQSTTALTHNCDADNMFDFFFSFLFFKPMSLPQESRGMKRGAEMSRMITLVPPCNPFNSLEKEEVIVS